MHSIYPHEQSKKPKHDQKSMRNGWLMSWTSRRIRNFLCFSKKKKKTLQKQHIATERVGLSYLCANNRMLRDVLKRIAIAKLVFVGNYLDSRKNLLKASSN